MEDKATTTTTNGNILPIEGEIQEPIEEPACQQTTIASKSVYSGTNVVPRTPHKTVLHVDVKEGDVANRIITVGDPSRAERIARLFGHHDGRPIFRHQSTRGFLTFTGTFQGFPLSIISIGMGLSMMDFFVREVRQVVDGPMIIVRFGTCGALQPSVPTGCIVVASEGSVKVVRNPDAFLPPRHTSAKEVVSPYLTFKPQPCDPQVTQAIAQQLRQDLGGDAVHMGLNASADSFYSSQGRKDHYFDDRNEDVLDTLRGQYPSVASMEMESFQLFALANSSYGTIKASAASIVVANRTTGEVCNEEILARLEHDGGHALMKALIGLPV